MHTLIVSAEYKGEYNPPKKVIELEIIFSLTLSIINPENN